GAENFEDKASAVNNFCIPEFLKVSLLDRRERGINKDKLDFQGFQRLHKLVDMPFCNVSCRADLALLEKLSAFDIKCYGFSKAFGFFKTRFGLNNAVNSVNDIGAYNIN